MQIKLVFIVIYPKFEDLVADNLIKVLNFKRKVISNLKGIILRMVITLSRRYRNQKYLFF